MDPIQTARDFVDKIYDVHLKDTEILSPVLRAGGITPVDDDLGGAIEFLDWDRLIGLSSSACFRTWATPEP